MIAKSSTRLCQRARPGSVPAMNAPNKTLCFIRKGKMAAAVLWTADNLAAKRLRGFAIASVPAFVDGCEEQVA